MCLDVKLGATPEVAENDIYCFKILNVVKGNTWYKRLFHNPALISPYRDFRYRQGREYRSDFSYERLVSNAQICGVNAGLHAFTDIDSAVEGLMFCASGYAPLPHNLRIFNAVIPRGATYYTGKFDSIPSYASNALVVYSEVK
jgi:hypothetical protein